MPDVREKQREARRKIIRQWAKLPKDKRQSMEGICEFARTAAQQNENDHLCARRELMKALRHDYLPPPGRGRPVATTGLVAGVPGAPGVALLIQQGVRVRAEMDCRHPRLDQGKEPLHVRRDEPAIIAGRQVPYPAIEEL